jgi:hypothetical protein
MMGKPYKPYKPYKLRNKQIAAALEKHPEFNYKKIAARFRVSEFLVGAVAKRAGLQHGRFGRSRSGVSSLLRAASIPKHVEGLRRRRAKQEKRIITFVQRHPEMTYAEMAEAFGVKKFAIGNLMYKSGIRRSRVNPEGLAEKVQMLRYIKKHPLDSYSDMSRSSGWKTRELAQVAREAGMLRGKGHGPSHNYGRPHTIATRGYLSRLHLAQRETFRKIMLKVWDAAGDGYREKLSRLMRSRWTPQARKNMSLILFSMWRAAKV